MTRQVHPSLGDTFALCCPCHPALDLEHKLLEPDHARNLDSVGAQTSPQSDPEKGMLEMQGIAECRQLFDWPSPNRTIFPRTQGSQRVLIFNSLVLDAVSNSIWAQELLESIRYGIRDRDIYGGGLIAGMARGGAGQPLEKSSEASPSAGRVGDGSRRYRFVSGNAAPRP